MIQVYTDGACSGNPGIGGWGVVILINTDKLASGAYFIRIHTDKGTLKSQWLKK